MGFVASFVLFSNSESI